MGRKPLECEEINNKTFGRKTEKYIEKERFKACNNRKTHPTKPCDIVNGKCVSKSIDIMDIIAEIPDTIKRKPNSYAKFHSFSDPNPDEHFKFNNKRVQKYMQKIDINYKKIDSRNDLYKVYYKACVSIVQDDNKIKIGDIVYIQEGIGSQPWSALHIIDYDSVSKKKKILLHSVHCGYDMSSKKHELISTIMKSLRYTKTGIDNGNYIHFLMKDECKFEGDVKDLFIWSKGDQPKALQRSSQVHMKIDEIPSNIKRKPNSYAKFHPFGNPESEMPLYSNKDIQKYMNKVNPNYESLNKGEKWAVYNQACKLMVIENDKFKIGDIIYIVQNDDDRQYLGINIISYDLKKKRKTVFETEGLCGYVIYHEKLLATIMKTLRYTKTGIEKGNYKKYLIDDQDCGEVKDLKDIMYLDENITPKNLS